MSARVMDLVTGPDGVTRAERVTAFTDLDTSTVDADRAAIFAVEFLVWWEQAGRVYYHGTDGGLEAFARDAVHVVGGWRNARRVLSSTSQSTRTLVEAKGAF